ncbi:MAG TPA: G1 family glutamic endopeptidase [Candidatus Babeliales bacterium]|jgi:hypothetical protein|nr:G1 family glutamic endopeptidase [Candidatus Babeliales bacterium]
MKLIYLLRNLLCVTALIFSVVVGAFDVEGLRYIECELQPIDRASKRQHYDEFKPNSEQSSASYGAFTHPHMPVKDATGTSQNWSGYAAVTNINHPTTHSVSAVYGSWVVPTLSSASHNTWCSLWVGIDGFSDSTVEQLGTEHDWYNGHQQNYAWFEMYPNYSYEIVGFPARPGDHISASVVYQGNNVFVLSIANTTAGVHTTVPTSYSTSRTAQRSSAEWIMEAPYSGGILPLSHFGTVNFSSCTATINGITGAINNSHWVFDDLTMVTGNGTVKAAPSALSSNGQAFAVVWHHE